MKWAIHRIAKILSKESIPAGYVQLYKSSQFNNSIDDTEESVCLQLDKLFEEIQAFESDIIKEWNNMSSGDNSIENRSES